jgi:hypothetical protein
MPHRVPYVPVLAHFPSRTRDSAVQKWFQNFGFNFFGQSQLIKGIFIDFLIPELTVTKKFQTKIWKTVLHSRISCSTRKTS